MKQIHSKLFITLIVLLLLTIPNANSLLIVEFGSIAWMLLVGIVIWFTQLFTIATQYRQHQHIKQQFARCLAPVMLKSLQKNSTNIVMSGETRLLTVMFCSIDGFTSLIEQNIKTPQKLTSVVNQFLTRMTTILQNNNGTVDKYIGDCVMTFWNAPIESVNQEVLAVKSALEMACYLKILNRDLIADGLFPVSINIGINTGIAVVGNLGSQQQFDYTCVGQTVNVAAKLQNLSKDYGVKILISQSTADNLDDKYLAVELDTIDIADYTVGFKIYTVISRERQPNTSSLQIAMAQHNKFLDAYNSQRWDRAIILAKSLTTAWNFELRDYYNLVIAKCNDAKTRNSN